MAEGSLPDSLELSSDSTLHQRHNQRFRRGRARPDPNRNLTGPDYDPPQQYRHFQQSAKPHFVHGSSTYPARFHPPYHQDDMARGRGRGKIGVGFGRGSGFRHQPATGQKPTEDVSPSGGNHGFGGIYNPTPPMEQSDTDGLSWRRETGRKVGGPGHEEHQDTRPKKSEKFSQDPRRRNRDEKGIRGDHMLDKQENQENNAVEAGWGTAKSREESHSSDMKVRNQRGQRDSNWNPYPHFDPPKTLLEPNRRKGPIKPPKPQEQGSSEKNGNYQDFPVQEFPVRVKLNKNATKEEPSWRAERGQGRRTPLQDRGQRRAHHFDPRAGQKQWDNVPKSKETQTGCLIEQLTEEKYECMVCCDVVRVMAPVWSCQSCFHVFHLNCIKKWARSPASQGDDSTEGWRCPACQNIVLKPPNSYTCFCGKVTNPEWQRTEIPHSCGDMCGKKRSGVDCNHPCNILCHPGPCPQCPAFIQKSCICGITSQPMRCGQAAGVHCNTMCGARLNCAEHTCTQVCHSGRCQPCQIQVEQDCYCGATCREVLCGMDKDGFDGSGHFSCEDPCGKMLDCEAHKCQQVCHPGPCKPCPRSPKLVKTCPCGQTPLTKLLELGYSERSICSDPIPSCGKTCNQPLVCGSDDTIHLCEKLCHEGSCGPCTLTSTIRCRCGSKIKEVPCATIHNEVFLGLHEDVFNPVLHDHDELTFTCDKRCNKKRLCGRHKCGEPCCVRLEHKCPLICGYKLNCGLHRCQEPCHRGNCQPCWQASFDELTCHCGLTVLYPPIACGTKPPECKNLCSRRHECDHPVFHNCHSEEKCPPCTYLTQKWCMGNHEQRSNIACHLQDISCGLVCNKLLDCEMHHCKRICHRAECLGEDVCQQPCVLPRPNCGHPCATRCHKGTGCPRNACTAKVALQCDCGRRKETVACLEAANTYQRYAAIAMASKLSDMQLGDSVDIAQLITKKEMKQTRLECDQDCATLERNRRLAEALQIDSAVDPFNTRSTSKYSDSLKDDARKDLKFVTEVEEKIKNMVELANKGKQPKRSYCFPPMNREHRKIVHELADVYAVESVSYDSEPKRNVVITAYRGKSSCPGSSLTSLIERETATRAPPPIAHIKQHSSKADSGSSWSKMVKEEPVIDYFDVQD